MKSNGIVWRPTPAESPDVNPIENLWHELKHFVRSEAKPMTLDELRAAIRHFWATRVTPEKCAAYINHLKKTIPKVVESDGKATGE